MPFIVQIRGSEVMGPGQTPDERYGEGVWGPAIYGTLNRTNGLSDADASTFPTPELCRVAILSLSWVLQNSPNEVRILEIP